MIGCEIKNDYFPNNPGNVPCESMFRMGRGYYSTQCKFPNFCPRVQTAGGDLFSPGTKRNLNRSLNYGHPIFTLSLNACPFYVAKLAAGKVSAKWRGFEEIDSNSYKARLKYKKYPFENVCFMTKNSNEDHRFAYSTKRNKRHNYFSGMWEFYRDGHVDLSVTKAVELEKTDETKINICSNPLDGVVGTKFVNLFSGKFLIEISEYTRSDSFSQRSLGL